MLTFDRPGYAQSPRQPGRVVADAARWSSLIADAAGASHFSVVGTSGGGPHAAATAALLPDRVTALCIDVGLGPAELPDFNLSDGLPPETQAELIAARRGEADLREFIESVDGESLEAWEHLLPPSDRAVLKRADVQREEAQEAEEWGTAGIDGWVDDDLAFFARPWGFLGSEIVAPTMLLYGGSDVLVPVSHGRAWEKVITHANLRVIDGGGHWLRDFERDYLNWFAKRSASSRLVEK